MIKVTSELMSHTEFLDYTHSIRAHYLWIYEAKFCPNCNTSKYTNCCYGCYKKPKIDVCYVCVCVCTVCNTHINLNIEDLAIIYD